MFASETNTFHISYVESKNHLRGLIVLFYFMLFSVSFGIILGAAKISFYFLFQSLFSKQKFEKIYEELIAFFLEFYQLVKNQLAGKSRLKKMV
jgi:hypothetical protein